MVAESRTARMTMEEYRAFERAADRKHEFFAGHVYAMAGGSRRHAALGRRIATLLAEAAGEDPCEVYNSDMRVRLSDQVQVYPDASVTCDRFEADDVVELTSIGARIPLTVLYARTAVPHAPVE
ncbi:MAG: Uma2 family endonuclease [Chloroflexota bacterium]